MAARQSEWWWFLLLGIALIVLGTAGIAVPFVVSLVAVKFFGVLLLVAGVAQVVSAFWEGQWSGLFIHLLMGILYTVVGGLIVGNPLEGMAVLTLMLATLLIVGGLFRVIIAMMLQFHMWGWVLLGGLVSLFLGILIWAQWPATSLVVIGLFLGIEMIFNGWSWVMLGLDLRRLPHKAG
ncbi:MAG: hypothetical protein A2W31_15315 [Planctomycetes bacterium RBG_16_64_10]|nr:MAG: hypothetical protein A2W31_15315 [Planctomycetes bacterium RBG_16_64_10]